MSIVSLGYRSSARSMQGQVNGVDKGIGNECGGSCVGEAHFSGWWLITAVRCRGGGRLCNETAADNLIFAKRHGFKRVLLTWPSHWRESGRGASHRVTRLGWPDSLTTRPRDRGWGGLDASGSARQTHPRCATVSQVRGNAHAFHSKDLRPITATHLPYARTSMHTYTYTPLRQRAHSRHQVVATSPR